MVLVDEAGLSLPHALHLRNAEASAINSLSTSCDVREEPKAGTRTSTQNRASRRSTMLSLGVWGGPGRMIQRSTGAASALLGIRLGKQTALRLSMLLALRSLLGSLQLPIDSGVATVVWSFLFASAQAAVLLGIAAERMSVGGMLGRIGAALIGPSDAPFIEIYGYIVMLAGPLVAVAEAAVVTYEIMLSAARLEQRTWDQRQSGIAKAGMASLAFLGFGTSIALVLIADTREVTWAVVAIWIVLLGLVTFVEGCNIMHAGLLALYCTSILCLGLSEHLDIYASVVLPALHSPTSRALQLMVTSSLVIFAIARGPRFLGAYLYTLERVEADPSLMNEQSSSLQGFLNTVTVLALTFRYLIYNVDVRVGEYHPIFCRSLQALLVLLVHVGLLRIDSAEVTEAQAHPSTASPECPNTDRSTSEYKFRAHAD